MQTLSQNRVEVTDISVEVMSELLVYIYTGRSPNVNKMAVELLNAADKVNDCALSGRLYCSSYTVAITYLQ